jgi:predicted DNA-binding antitoxin AbrB/MazE fold protein
VDTLRIEAVYEHGSLKLQHDLPLQEGQRVLVTIQPSSAVERLSGMVPWTRDPEELHRLLSDPDEGQWGSRDI